MKLFLSKTTRTHVQEKPELYTARIFDDAGWIFAAEILSLVLVER